MDELVGIDKDTAEKVIAFREEHADEALPRIQKPGVLGKLPGGVGEKLGGLFR
jgi:hypothetical protein